jgi:8-oxo-dGTP diphosphatase
MSRRDSPPTPRVGVGCLVISEGRLLLVRGRRGRWSTPGGHLDFGESPERAAVRETLEETGIRIGGVEFLAVTNDVLTDEGTHYVTIWMRGVADDTAISIRDTNEISEAGWHPLDDLPHPRHVFFENLLAGRTMPCRAPGLSELVGSPGSPAG